MLSGTSRTSHFVGPAPVSYTHLTTPLSDRISKDLKKRGFKFVGSTIVYAYLQSIGMVNDHVADCFVYRELAGMSSDEGAS